MRYQFLNQSETLLDRMVCVIIERSESKYLEKCISDWLPKHKCYVINQLEMLLERHGVINGV